MMLDDNSVITTFQVTTAIPLTNSIHLQWYLDVEFIFLLPKTTSKVKQVVVQETLSGDLNTNKWAFSQTLQSSESLHSVILSSRV